jgi:DNA mismatch repair ATPase MutL
MQIMDQEKVSRFIQMLFSKGKFMQLKLKIKELFKRNKDKKIFTSTQQLKKQQIQSLYNNVQLLHRPLQGGPSKLWLMHRISKSNGEKPETLY